MALLHPGKINYLVRNVKLQRLLILSDRRNIQPIAFHTKVNRQASKTIFSFARFVLFSTSRNKLLQTHKSRNTKILSTKSNNLHNFANRFGQFIKSKSFTNSIPDNVQNHVFIKSRIHQNKEIQRSPISYIVYQPQSMDDTYEQTKEHTHTVNFRFQNNNGFSPKKSR